MSVFKQLEHKVTLLKEKHKKELAAKDEVIDKLHKQIEGYITESIANEKKLTEMEESISQFATTI